MINIHNSPINFPRVARGCGVKNVFFDGHVLIIEKLGFRST